MNPIFVEVAREMDMWGKGIVADLFAAHMYEFPGWPINELIRVAALR
jgi:hypothetical protein